MSNEKDLPSVRLKLYLTRPPHHRPDLPVPAEVVVSNPDEFRSWLDDYTLTHWGMIEIHTAHAPPVTITDDLDAMIQNLCRQGAFHILCNEAFHYVYFNQPEDLYLTPRGERVQISGEPVMDENDAAFDVILPAGDLLAEMLECAQLYIRLRDAMNLKPAPFTEMLASGRNQTADLDEALLRNGYTTSARTGETPKPEGNQQDAYIHEMHLEILRMENGAPCDVVKVFNLGDRKWRGFLHSGVGSEECLFRIHLGSMSGHFTLEGHFSSFPAMLVQMQAAHFRLYKGRPAPVLCREPTSAARTLGLYLEPDGETICISGVNLEQTPFSATWPVIELEENAERIEALYQYMTEHRHEIPDHDGRLPGTDGWRRGRAHKSAFLDLWWSEASQGRTFCSMRGIEVPNQIQNRNRY